MKIWMIANVCVTLFALLAIVVLSKNVIYVHDKTGFAIGYVPDP